jgi:hypothetical protein
MFWHILAFWAFLEIFGFYGNLWKFMDFFLGILRNFWIFFEFLDFF